MTVYYLNTQTGVVTKEDGSIVPQDDTTQAYLDYSAWLSAGNSPVLASAAPTSSSRRITVLAFRNRFTSAEKVAIDLASIDNPAAPTQTRQIQASLRVYQKDLDTATFVDLDRVDTQNGVLALEQFGIIAAGRASQILNADIQDVERPLGNG